MKIQSLSIAVPTGKCVNDCKFCVSKTHHEEYENRMDVNSAGYAFAERDYLNRLAFARDNGCNTMMITGTAEPQQNRKFLATLGRLNNSLDKPFRWIEMQTSGAMLDDNYLRFLRDQVGVSTISLSLSSLDDNSNMEYTGALKKIYTNELCKSIKDRGFNLRISLNMTDEAFMLDNTSLKPKEVFMYVGDVLCADQITFRVLYNGESDCAQNKWIKEHRAPQLEVDGIYQYIKENGRKLEILEFGQVRYDVNGLSTVVDDDCMATNADKDALKYLILRPDCHLYSKWDSKASLLF